MYYILLFIIYISFISLGLPDSLLGASWPAMHTSINADVSSIGLVSMIIYFSTIISSLLSDRLLKRFGTGIIVSFSVLLTSIAVFLYSMTTTFFQLCLFALPYGLGAGAIDICLNNYVALNLSSKHMNWLHCCWGVGAIVGPYIIGFSIDSGYRKGYLIVSIIQMIIAIIMFFSIPLWKKNAEKSNEENVVIGFKDVFKIKGVIYSCLAFLFYCCLETIPISYASSYFSIIYKIDNKSAAFIGSLFFIGITVSRMISGFISIKIDDKYMVRYGLSLILFASVMMLIPFNTHIPSLVALVLLGLGCGPIYPSYIHMIPINFDRKYSSSIIGIQIAFAYLGFTFMPLLFSRLIEIINISILPKTIFILALCCLLFSEILNRVIKYEKSNN